MGMKFKKMIVVEGYVDSDSVDIHIKTNDVEVTRICVDDICTDVYTHGYGDIVVEGVGEPKSICLNIRISL